MCNLFAMKIFYESIEIGDSGKGCRALLVVKTSFEVHHGCYLLSKSVVGRGLG